MNDDGLATDEQLARIERRVLERLDRRAAARRRITRGAVTMLVLGLLGGGIAIWHPLLASTSGGASGSAAEARSEPAAGSAGSLADRTVRCHLSAAADSPVVLATLGSFSPSAVTRTCRQAIASAAASPSSFATADASASAVPFDVLCRDDGRLNAFPSDSDPDTLCARNGMRGA